MNGNKTAHARIAFGTGVVSCLILMPLSQAALVTDPNDARSWQGATVGTFAALYYGSDTPANRALVTTNGLLDDGLFNFAGATPATLISALNTGSGGFSTGTTPGDYSYGTGGTATANANSIDNTWIQSSGRIGDTVFDLGAASYGAVIFPVVDHGPLPQETIESTVYLSNDQINWTEAVVERVWLEGFHANLGVQWDGFSYAVGTGTNSTFRYASIIHGGPGALINDGDDEINGIVGINRNFTPSTNNVPDGGGTLALFGLSLGAMGWIRRQLRKH